MNLAIKMCILIVFVFASFHLSLPLVNAVKSDENNPSVLVVYHPENGEVDEQNNRMLDILISHFTSDLTFKPIADVARADLKDVTHIFYYGYQSEHIPQTFQDVIRTFGGTFVALGENIEQLGDRFSFITQVSYENFTAITLAGTEDKVTSILPHQVKNVLISNESELLLIALDGEGNQYPLMVRKDSAYYFATSTIGPPLSPYLAEVLHEVFNIEHQETHPGYIRLEDVHPLVEAEKVVAIAKVLKDRNIPYMIAVIPVYIHPETQEEYHLSDSPDLLEALKYMQDNGGSIVLHGYTHQFRDSETGEGFEFWDVENNMPIYHEANEKVVKKSVSDFDSPKAFNQYIKKQQEFEKLYITKKLTRGINELVNYGLYPLAFEAPHYTMSQHGYAVTSEFFSTYVGQVQISDQDWEIMTIAPFITNPSFLNGMILLPETIGYVENSPLAVEKMLREANKYTVVRDGMVAGFYHPYLGVEGFITLLDSLEKIDGVEWIDLKQMKNKVKTGYVDITTEAGEVHVSVDRVGLYTSSFNYPLYHLKKVVKNLTWIMVGSGSLAVIVFINYIFFSRNKNRRYRKYRRGGRIG
ncbi:hypothetical protein GCM10011351_27460 [Paraliobacillus quinghaiensis]|uniref:DUF2334 domain-containing protein n=1 Tax=Paraliobacillus quinghaiensis TaxID=470815 RepID=A0A917TVW5_9BACI|nr:polysaccharide deacetylase family protein [Paraliobacillus quinghaiensis]GGM39824.1 hypothetical protein GCM10011351_27460 [Paraliobacillus quinghaiensis]